MKWQAFNYRRSNVLNYVLFPWSYLNVKPHQWIFRTQKVYSNFCSNVLKLFTHVQYGKIVFFNDLKYFLWYQLFRSITGEPLNKILWNEILYILVIIMYFLCCDLIYLSGQFIIGFTYCIRYWTFFIIPRSSIFNYQGYENGSVLLWYRLIGILN